MHLHGYTAYRLVLAFMLTATAFGCGSEGESDEAVEETSAALEAQAQPVGNTCCPQGDSWFISEHSPGDVFYDHNGDGLICFKPVPGTGGSSVDEPGFSIKDNNNPCP
ncbi:hypothetical protein [Polyangium sp. 15x6]|uniref:hypothetical protein n=1 Tax=Polyangium sp. 15x6 TaxID=3042687 RepID=UPI002499B98F|nr:hypothetical protein [Polyangium sp. 15x6]